MTDWTPTTAHVRDAYVRQLRDAFVASAGEHEAEFDRWLRQVQAQAWAQGAARVIHGTLDEMDWQDEHYEDDNPYLGDIDG